MIRSELVLPFYSSFHLPPPSLPFSSLPSRGLQPILPVTIRLQLQPLNNLLPSSQPAPCLFLFLFFSVFFFFVFCFSFFFFLPGAESERKVRPNESLHHAANCSLSHLCLTSQFSSAMPCSSTSSPPIFRRANPPRLATTGIPHSRLGDGESDE